MQIAERGPTLIPAGKIEQQFPVKPGLRVANFRARKLSYLRRLRGQIGEFLREFDGLYNNQ